MGVELFEEFFFFFFEFFELFLDLAFNLFFLSDFDKDPALHRPRHAPPRLLRLRRPRRGLPPRRRGRLRRPAAPARDLFGRASGLPLRLLERLCLPPGAVRNVVMARDIVPRAFTCDYSSVASLLGTVRREFRDLECLQTPASAAAAAAEAALRSSERGNGSSSPPSSSSSSSPMDAALAAALEAEEEEAQKDEKAAAQTQQQQPSNNSLFLPRAPAR